MELVNTTIVAFMSLPCYCPLFGTAVVVLFQSLLLSGGPIWESNGWQAWWLVVWFLVVVHRVIRDMSWNASHVNVGTSYDIDYKNVAVNCGIFMWMSKWIMM